VLGAFDGTLVVAMPEDDGLDYAVKLSLPARPQPL
jgi:hypothetical protein